jgi:hypothetical protein
MTSIGLRPAVLFFSLEQLLNQTSLRKRLSCQLNCQQLGGRSGVSGALDRIARKPDEKRPGMQKHPLPYAEIGDAEFSWRASLRRQNYPNVGA